MSGENDDEAVGLALAACLKAWGTGQVSQRRVDEAEKRLREALAHRSIQLVVLKEDQ